MPNWTQTSVMMMCGAGTARWSFSAPAQRLLISSWVPTHQHGGPWDVVPLSCPPEVSVALCCCFWLFEGPLSACWAATSPPPRTARCFVCRVLLCTKTVAANCVCFLSSPTSPNILLFLTPPPPLQPFLFLNFPPSSCCSCTLTPPYPTPVCWPLLCCGGPQKRSGQMVSDDFRALLISTGNSLVLLLAWSSLRVSAGPKPLTFIPFNLN